MGAFDGLITPISHHRWSIPRCPSSVPMFFSASTSPMGAFDGLITPISHHRWSIPRCPSSVPMFFCASTSPMGRLMGLSHPSPIIDGRFRVAHQVSPCSFVQTHRPWGRLMGLSRKKAVDSMNLPLSIYDRFSDFQFSLSIISFTFFWIFLSSTDKCSSRYFLISSVFSMICFAVS